MKEAIPFSASWALDRVIELDRSFHGILTHSFFLKGYRRHLLFSAIAADLPSEAILRHFEGMSPRTIATDLFGSCPDGLLGILRRLPRKEPLEPDHYAQIHCILEEPKNPKRVALLQYAGAISSSQVKAILALDSDLVHPTVLEDLRCEEEAHLLNAISKALQEVCPTLNPSSLKLSLGKARDISKSVNGLLARHLVTEPIHLPQGFQHLGSGQQLDQAGMRFRNCLRNRLVYVASSIYAYACYEDVAIVELLKTNTAWLMVGVYKERNLPPSREEYDTIARKLLDVGIDAVRLSPPEKRAMIRRFSGHGYDFSLPNLLED